MLAESPPTSSIAREQKTIDVSGAERAIVTEGRHDACICPRIVPVVEAMMAVTLCDFAIRAGGIPEVII